MQNSEFQLTKSLPTRSVVGHRVSCHVISFLSDFSLTLEYTHSLSAARAIGQTGHYTGITKMFLSVFKLRQI